MVLPLFSPVPDNFAAAFTQSLQSTQRQEKVSGRNERGSAAEGSTTERDKGDQ